MSIFHPSHLPSALCRCASWPSSPNTPSLPRS